MASAPRSLESSVGIYYLRQIPGIARLINERFAKVAGVQSVTVNVRVVNRLVVYVFIDMAASEKCESDLILASEVGIVFKNPETNQARLPRLWLEERAAEVDCEAEVHKRRPQIEIEWVTMLRDAEHKGSIIPV